jgi:hypothetical protein
VGSKNRLHLIRRCYESDFGIEPMFVYKSLNRGFDPIWDLDVCQLSLSVSLCFIFCIGRVLAKANLSASESYQLSIRSLISEVNSELEQARAPNP